MIYILTALYPEASPLIRELHLKKTSCRAYQQFQSESADILLTITGAGPVRAAAAAGFILGQMKEEEVSSAVLLNFGSAAGLQNADQGVLYRIHSLRNKDSGRSFCPDLFDRTCPEASLVSSSRIYRQDSDTTDTAGDVLDPVALRPADLDPADSDLQLQKKNEIRLLDMEGAAIYEAASLFLGPHQMHFYKYVSDHGSNSVTPAMLEEGAEKAVEDLRAVIEDLRAQGFADDDKRLKQEEGKLVEELSLELHASETMRLQIRQIIRYASCAQVDWRAIWRVYREEGILPCRDRRAGKQILTRFLREVAG